MTLLNSEIREFNWLTRYLVTKTDMQNLQLWLQTFASIGAQQTGEQGNIVYGLQVTPASPSAGTTTFTLSVGFGSDKQGRPLIVAEETVLTNTATYANNVKAILILKYLGTGAVPTTTSVESGNLQTIYGAEMELVLGTPAASPAYPDISAETGLILGGFTFNSSGVLTASDYSIASYPRLNAKGDAYWTRAITNPTIINVGTQLTHYNITLDDDLTVLGTLVSGNINTNTHTLTTTGGTLVVNF